MSKTMVSVGGPVNQTEVSLRVAYETCGKESSNTCIYFKDGKYCAAKHRVDGNCKGYAEFEYLEYLLKGEKCRRYLGDTIRFSGGFSDGYGDLEKIVVSNGSTGLVISGKYIKVYDDFEIKGR